MPLILEGAWGETELKLMLATRRAILKKKSNAHMLTMPTHTVDESYFIILTRAIRDSYNIFRLKRT